MKEVTISLLITGGTIDKDYHLIKGELCFNQSHLPELLEQANSTLKIASNVILMKDSLEMTDLDRQTILQACHQTKQNQIVITHGTDTMVQTALLLQQDQQLKDKTIVLTGAMRPYKLGGSDASFNIGAALSAVQLALPGVYISMNGHLFEANQVEKNLTLGQFQKT